MHSLNDAAQGQCKLYKLLRSLYLFTDISDEVVARFYRAAEIVCYKKGSTLYIEGEPANYFYIIVSGWLRKFRTTDDGEEVNLNMLTEHGIVGYNALFEQGKYTVSAQVVEDTRALKIPLSTMREQLSLSSRLAFNLMSIMVQRQRHHEAQVEQYLLFKAPKRIACFVVGLCKKQELQDGLVLDLPYKKSLIASTLGMTEATFSRALNFLRKNAGLSITGTQVKINSVADLLRFVESAIYDKYNKPGLEKVSSDTLPA